MRIDLHNHTVRCNHAEGTIDAYIQKAIALGIDIYGFSEHAAMDFDEGYRLGFDEMAPYQHEILEARERYKERIDIEIVVLDDLFALELAGLQPIDRIVDLLEALAVTRGKELPVPRLGQRLEVGRVEIPVAADPDGVELHIAVADQAADLIEADTAGVVDPVGEQDRDLRLGVTLVEDIIGLKQRIVDGGAFPGNPRLLHRQDLSQELLFKRQRRSDKSDAGEVDQTDPVVFAFVDEIAHHFLDHIKFALEGIGGIEAPLSHRIAGVDDEHDIPPLFVDLLVLVGQHRRGQGQQEADDTDPFEDLQPTALVGMDREQPPDVGKIDRLGPGGAVAPTDPEEQDQPQHPGMFETKPTHRRPACRVRSGAGSLRPRGPPLCGICSAPAEGEAD